MAKIVEGNGGYMVYTELNNTPKIFLATEYLKMLEWVGKHLVGKYLKMEDR